MTNSFPFEADAASEVSDSMGDPLREYVNSPYLRRRTVDGVRNRRLLRRDGVSPSFELSLDGVLYADDSLVLERVCLALGNTDDKSPLYSNKNWSMGMFRIFSGIGMVSRMN
ncbi:hypothetical protein H257_12618 [Aphanomyces astaci]|uniref:Uncharacterized protein n=1 Tax=Aphanomyces astaci TaxID=112090 RepID=W4G0F9_APHAT|nr:hypothetical protein H257_12618 [Aphanomyces astaci]ETV72524.1 hypothetical protein H257_12618 [Aphanomyces astaci]|eukprot:XP_009838206.1 hypothetical protein H257_12618 [Aphanomyces astaci]